MRGYVEKMLRKYKRFGRISFAMPGHKNTRAMKRYFALPDVTELADTDSLHNPHSAILKAEKRIAELTGAENSFILINGSTSGIFAMLASCTKRGDKVLLSRSAHMSAINACQVLGLLPVFFEHKIYEKFQLHGEADISDLIKKLEGNDIACVLVTSPNYFGAVSDIKSIARVLKDKNIPLLVDEAHGAHFMLGGKLPESAIRLGADMSVISTHKTLNAFNQTAVLNLKSRLISPERVGEVLTFFETSSPSYPLVASAEGAVYDCIRDRKKWEKLVERTQKLREDLRSKTRILIPSTDDGFFEFDKTRLVFNFSEYNLSGYEVSDILREYYNIDIEMADAENIVLIATKENTREEFGVLRRALIKICKTREESEMSHSQPYLPEVEECVVAPSEVLQKEREYLELEKSIGRISAKTVTVYPPAVPVLIPGSYITREAIDYLMSTKGEITGLVDGKIPVIKGDSDG